MRIEVLEYLVKVAELNSISAAAAELFITPQGISKSMMLLEAEIGTPLFFRNGNRITLTAAGQAVYHKAKEILELKNEMLLEAAMSNTEGDSSAFCVLATAHGSATYLSKVLNTFYHRNTHTNITILEMLPEEILKRMSESEFLKNTILLFSLPQQPIIERIIEYVPDAYEYVELDRSPLLGCTSVKSSIAEMDSLTLEDFWRYPFVAFSGDIQLLTNAAHTDCDRELEILLKSSNLNLCRAVLAENKDVLGITTRLDEKYMKVSGVKSIPIEPEIPIVYGYVTAKQNKNSALQEFIEILLEEFR